MEYILTALALQIALALTLQDTFNLVGEAGTGRALGSGDAACIPVCWQLVRSVRCEEISVA
jgi:hypothetical protein